jgi:putative endonuclease
MSDTKCWFVYLIECTDGSIYTRSHPPARLLGCEAHPDRSAASKAEYRIKQMTAAEKRLFAASLTLVR